MSNILFVIVLYQIKQEQSRAWQSLQASMGNAGAIYIHDNTKENIFLAKAYNRALTYAHEKGYHWMVLLDADTEVTPSYLEAIKQATQLPEDTVYCPTLENKHKKLSPRSVYGIPVAFNSGMLIPVKIIDFIGGFNEQYPLDYLDYWFCHQLYLRHIPLALLPTTLSHSLSVMDYSTMPQWRYLSIMEAEKRFAIETGHLCLYRLLLACRLIKWSITGHKYVRETYHALRHVQ